MTAAGRWTAAIVGLLGLSVAAVTTLIVAAARADGRQVMAQQARDRALGWTASYDFDGNDVVVTLRDRSGAPVRGAKVAVSMYHRTHAARVLVVDAVETAATPGVYRGSGGELRPGIHTITGGATLGDVEFTFDGWAEAL